MRRDNPSDFPWAPSRQLPLLALPEDPLSAFLRRWIGRGDRKLHAFGHVFDHVRRKIVVRSLRRALAFRRIARRFLFTQETLFHQGALANCDGIAAAAV